MIPAEDNNLTPVNLDAMPMSEDRYKTLINILPSKGGHISELTNFQLQELEARLLKALRIVYNKEIFGDERRRSKGNN